MVSALAATPQPNEAAKAIAANPSSAALRYSSSAPRPRPSLSEPRIVSGPVQNSSDEATNPSTNRRRSAEPSSRVSRDCSQPPSDSTRSSSRSRDPTMPPTSNDPRTTSIGALEPMWATRARSVTASADRIAISRVTRPRPSVTTSRVRCDSRCPSSTPRPAPTSTVATLTRVPIPGNKGLL